MSTEVDIKELSDDLGKAVKETRQVAEDLEKKFDGVDLEKMKNIDGTIAKLSQSISDASVYEENNKKFQEQMQEQIALLAANATDTGVQQKSESAKQFSVALRKATAFAAYDGMQNDVVREIVDNQMYGIDDVTKEMVIKDMTVGSNPDGGYLVPREMGDVIMGRIFETSPMRAVATVITSNASEVEFVLDDQEADAGWVGEVQSRPDTGTPQIGKIVIPAHELYAQPEATQKLIDDAGVDIESWLANKVADKFSRVENTAFVAGDGSQKPKGFLTYDAWSTAGQYQRGAVEQINSRVNSGFDGDSFKTIQNSLIANYQTPAVWMMKRVTWAEVTKLKDSQGRYLFDMISNLRDGDVLQLLGKRVVLADDMPEIAQDSLSVAYGDFGMGYTIVDRIGIRVLRDPYTNKPFIKFYTTKRTGGAVTNYEAIKILKLAA